VRKVGHEFGIAVLVTSHLLGELERVCREIVVIDGGRLLRHSTTASVTAQTLTVALEVDGPHTDLQHRLQNAGIAVRSDGRLLHVDVSDDTTYDVVRDTVADLGLGLVRMERQRHRMTEIFTDGTPAEGGVRG
jgi:ABC-2 type transport system ATP-binding protein